MIFFVFMWGIFFAKKNGDQDSSHKNSSANVKSVFDIISHAVRASFLTDSIICKYLRQGRSYHGSQSNQEGLDAKSCCSLFVREIISYKSPEWLHGNIERGIHHHHHPRANPQCGNN